MYSLVLPSSRHVHGLSSGNPWHLSDSDKYQECLDSGATEPLLPGRCPVAMRPPLPVSFIYKPFPGPWLFKRRHCSRVGWTCTMEHASLQDLNLLPFLPEYLCLPAPTVTACLPPPPAPWKNTLQEKDNVWPTELPISPDFQGRLPLQP